MHPISKQWTRIIPVRIYEQFVEIRINPSDPLGHTFATFIHGGQYSTFAVCSPIGKFAQRDSTR
jgi:hypothetical protein